MAEVIYRSVKIVLQNSTNEMLVVQGTATLIGAWSPKQAPSQGQTVDEQSAIEWISQSTELGSGVSGYVRLGSSSGFFTVIWTLPWSGTFEARVDGDGVPAWISAIIDSHPDHISVMVTVDPDIPDIEVIEQTTVKQRRQKRSEPAVSE